MDMVKSEFLKYQEFNFVGQVPLEDVFINWTNGEKKHE